MTSTYRFWTSNILTGQITADEIPIVANQMGMALCGIGRLTGYLPLNVAPSQNLRWLSALDTRKTILWCSQDRYPIWGGVLWDLPHRSVLDGTMPIAAATLESLFAKRLITGGLVINNTDILQIATQIVQYGISPALGQNTQVAGLQLSTTTEAGVTDSWTFGTSNMIAAGVDTYSGTYSDYQATGDALSLLSSSDGFEYSFAPVPTPTGAAFMLRLGFPHLGATTPFKTLQHPGNVADYAYARMGSNSSNWIVGTSTSNGGSETFTSQLPHGVDQADLDAGAPLLQMSVTWPGQGATSQDQINAYVDALLPAVSGDSVAPQLLMESGHSPLVREIGLGDAVRFAATSQIHPADPRSGAPGLQLTGRYTAWDLVPPGPQQEEKTTYTLGNLSGYVSTQVA